MRLVLIVLHANLFEIEGKSDKTIDREMTGKAQADMAAFAEIVGAVAVKAWNNGVAAGQALRRKEAKKLKMTPEVQGSIDGRVSSAFAEASGVLAVRWTANQKNRLMQDRALGEYVKKLKGTARAVIQDAGNAGLIAGARKDGA